MPLPTQGGFPKGLYSGTRAETVQFYDEANKKNGSQWVASRRVVDVPAGGKLYSIIKTRTLPLDLKQRVFSYTGRGLIARFYTGFTPQTLPSPEVVYCLRPGKPAFRDFDLYALAAALRLLATSGAQTSSLMATPRFKARGPLRWQVGMDGLSSQTRRS